ncbi:hypothetical protein N431DRAFT_438271 [Stipitochalara longipes BDJ]|nr:hypothetical protein N431DRAFT_438271 [Stipitochalara longipes BDJ]
MAGRSDTSSTGIRLDVFYYFGEKELMIRFQTREQAVAYQAKNPEGRILADKGECDVWLPIHWTMKCFRSSSLGMIIIFGSKDEARVWQQRSVLGQRIEGEAGVFIQRDWSEKEFQKLLGVSSSNLRSLMPKMNRDSRASSKEKAVFQVAQSHPSKGPEY